MTRTVISLDPEDKAWLDKEAKERHVPMTQIVREAVRRLRKNREVTAPDFKQILKRTAGIWREEDGLAYQRALRAEWDTTQ